MCGIVGYVGRAEAAPILLDGLRRLEYRGYDSAGVAIVNGKQIETRKCAGRIANLAKLMTEKPPSGQYGISHTRWATHGKVTDENAHPHFDQSGKIALVHNGVIENYAALREQLEREGGHKFTSDTDTEVLAHLIGSIYEQIDGADSKARLVNATRAALKQVIGTYGIALMWPQTGFAARKILVPVKPPTASSSRAAKTARDLAQDGTFPKCAALCETEGNIAERDSVGLW